MIFNNDKLILQIIRRFSIHCFWTCEKKTNSVLLENQLNVKHFILFFTQYDAQGQLNKTYDEDM